MRQIEIQNLCSRMFYLILLKKYDIIYNGKVYIFMGRIKILFLSFSWNFIGIREFLVSSRSINSREMNKIKKIFIRGNFN